MTLSAEEERRNLETIALFIAIDVPNAIRAEVVMGAAKLAFYESPDSFFTNPANTWVYSAVQALEERAVVRISEVLKDDQKLFPVGESIRRKIDLTSHRHALSHPSKVKWQKKSMQDFYDAARHHLDLRPALIWDMQLSINERLSELGGNPQVERVEVIPAMAMALRDIHRLSMKPEARSAIPDEKSLVSALSAFTERYLDFLVDHPDGRV